MPNSTPLSVCVRHKSLKDVPSELVYFSRWFTIRLCFLRKNLVVRLVISWLEVILRSWLGHSALYPLWLCFHELIQIEHKSHFWSCTVGHFYSVCTLPIQNLSHDLGLSHDHISCSNKGFSHPSKVLWNRKTWTLWVCPILDITSIEFGSFE